MKSRKTFATVLEEMKFFTRDAIEKFESEALEKDLSLTSLIVSKGLTTKPMLTSILQKNKDNLLLGELLVETNIIKPSIVAKALSEQQKSKQKSIGTIIEELGLISHENLLDALCTQLEIIKITPEAELVQTIQPALSGKFMTTNLVFPYLLDGNDITMLMVNPFNHELVVNLKKFYSKYTLTIAYVSKMDLLFFFDSLKIRKLSESFEIASQSIPIEVVSDNVSQDKESVNELEETLKILKIYLKKAIELNASDIHLEPMETSLRIRIALSGYLKVLTHFPKTISARMVNAIKAACGMDISSRRVPDDGRFTIKYNNVKYSLRVSTYPCIYGENCVIRILRQDAMARSLEGLGFSPANVARIKESILTPSGVILATGPTGVGKTTTLYSILQDLLVEEKHVITFEDPIEYSLDGATQAALNEKAGFTFDTALPAIMRQNPDVIMVGEVRDTKTANAIIRAALTGHKVLSTIHTENSTSTLNRLIKMEVEHFLLHETLDLIIAQRLVRISCPHCLEAYTPPGSLLKLLNIPVEDVDNYTFKKGMGSINGVKCEKCDGMGYAGQTSIHELLSINFEVARAISEKKTMWEIRETAIKKAGLITLREDCLYKVNLGITTLEECLRVTPDLDEPSRPIKTIIGLSERTSDFAPCDLGIVKFGQDLLSAAKMVTALGPETAEKMITELTLLGFIAEAFYSFSLSDLEKGSYRTISTQVSTFVGNKSYCHHFSDEQSRCQQCTKAKSLLLPFLERNHDNLYEVAIIADRYNAYIFHNSSKNNLPEWKVLLVDPIANKPAP